MLQRRASEISGGEQQMLRHRPHADDQPEDPPPSYQPCEGIAPLLVESIRDAPPALRAEGMPMLVAEQNRILADRR